MERKNKILIIEDHDSIRILLSNYLGKQYDVVTKIDGLEALAWMSNGNIPDFILLDYNMPRINGVDFLKNIRNSSFFKAIPVIVVTASEDNDIQAQCKDLGITDILTKPFSPIKLKERIETVLSERKSVSTNS